MHPALFRGHYHEVSTFRQLRYINGDGLDRIVYHREVSCTEWDLLPEGVERIDRSGDLQRGGQVDAHVLRGRVRADAELEVNGSR